MLKGPRNNTPFLAASKRSDKGRYHNSNKYQDQNDDMVQIQEPEQDQRVNEECEEERPLQRIEATKITRLYPIPLASHDDSNVKNVTFK